MNAHARDGLLWSLRQYCILFPNPVEVTLPNGEVHLVGGGGGFSRTFFDRGMHCERCGGCCAGHRIAWFVWEGREDIPLEPIDFKLNGSPAKVFMHLNRHSSVCDYYVGNGCALHGPTKPLFCQINPQMGVYPSQGRLWYFKRLPPRNWRWPQCPVNLDEYPPNVEEDVSIFRGLIRPLVGLRGWDPRMSELPERMRELYDRETFFRLSGGRSLLPFEEVMKM